MIKLRSIKPNPNNPRIELRDIQGFPSYQAGSDGFIYNKKTGKKLQPGVTLAGYGSLTLCEEGVRHSKSPHRLIALAFFGPSDLDVNHKNGNKLDNRPDNLEYSTKSENSKHAVRNRLLVPNTVAIAESKRKRIARCDLETGAEIQVYESAHEAAKITGINRGNICLCARNKAAHAGNFKWRYV